MDGAERDLSESNQVPRQLGHDNARARIRYGSEERGL
jgi:hypothetical protein